jgi:excisionase family DNA binding protein
MTDQVFLSTKGAASLLGVKVSTIYKWVQIKKIPYRKHGRLVKFDRRSLLEWSNMRETKPYSEPS